MKRIERTIATSASQDKVWAFLSDFTTTEQWDPPTVSTKRISGDGGIGTVYRNVSKLLGREVEIEYTVVQFEPSSRLQLSGRATAMRMLDTIEVQASPSGTRVHYLAEFQPQGPARLFEPLLGPGLKRLGDRAKAQLERCLARL